MKRLIIAAALLISTCAVYAASCQEGKIVLTGQTCGVVDGHCACTGNGN